jgi:CheY-like chemotaxis protein
MAKVLIVDDNELFRRINAEFLKLDGHDILLARNGRETLDIVQSEQPDILLLDIMMPGMDGYEICRQIKEDPVTRETFVVMLTAVAGSERFRSFQAGADEHITKPIPSRELRDLVRKLATRKELNHQP